MEGSIEASRFRTALALAETGVRLVRQRLHRAEPEASSAAIDEAVRRWIADRPMDAEGRALPPTR